MKTTNVTLSKEYKINGSTFSIKNVYGNKLLKDIAKEYVLKHIQNEERILSNAS